MKIFIQAMGHAHPRHVVSNDFFSSLEIGSDSEWIRTRTGVEKRNFVLAPEQIRLIRQNKRSVTDFTSPDLDITALSKQAWKLLEERNVSGYQPLDLLICGTSVPDWDIPSNACVIAKALSLSCQAFDVNSACSSFVVDLHVARGLLGQGMAKNIAIINPERYSLRMDYRDRNSCILFGDAASVSWLTVEYNGDFPALELIDTYIESSPAGAFSVQIPYGKTFWQDGKAVQKFAIKKTLSSVHHILDKNQLTIADIAYFIGHQANLRMLNSITKKLGLLKEKHLSNVSTYGNQGAAGAPCVLSQNWKKWKKGDYILVAVVGAGLTWGAALFRGC